MILYIILIFFRVVLLNIVSMVMDSID